MTQKSVLERKNMANELRKAHFSLGNEQTIHESKYSTMYQDHSEHIKSQNNNDQQQILNRSRQQNIQLEMQPRLADNHYKSISQSDYQKHQKYLKNQLDEEFKKDIRKQHFVFGNDDTSKVQTESQRNFYTQNIDYSVFNDKSESAKQLRQHSHNFGDNKQYYSTIYDQSHNKNIVATIDIHQSDQLNIKEQAIALRKTNLILGSDKDQYRNAHHSLNQDISKQKANQIGQQANQVNIEFGSDVVKHSTIAQNTFKCPGLVQNRTDPNILKDFKATHFNLGNENHSYMTENRQQYQQSQAKKEKNIQNPNSIRQTNICMGNQSYASYISVYEQQFGKKQVIDQVQAINQRQKVNLVVGYDNNQYVSEHQENFPNLNLKAKDRNINLISEPSGQYGTDTNDWQSVSKQVFVDNSKNRVKNEIDYEQQSNLRNQHFTYGFEKPSFKNSQAEIGSRLCAPNKIDPQISKLIKQTNYTMGTDKLDYKSINKSQY